MKKLLLIFFCLLVAPVYGQSSKTQLTTEINTNLPTNGVNQITAATLRTTLIDMVNSWLDLGGAASLLCPTNQYVTGFTSLSIPQCSSITTGSIPTAALTSNNDTNVTITLGGSPTTALVNAASISLGWSGTLAASRLNSNVVQSVVNDTNVTGSITAQSLTLGWTGALGLSRGGLGGSQFAATANQVPVFPGGGAAAVPTSIVNSLGSATGLLDAPVSYTANHVAANSDCENTMLLGGNAQFTLTINSVASYTCSRFKIKNIDTYTGTSSGRGKLISISGLTNFWLMPQYEVQVIANGSVWTTDKPIIVPDSGVSIGYVGRWMLPATTVINVGGTGSSDTANDGLATGTGAFATIQHAINVACNAIDQQYQTFTIQVADGTYTVPLHLCNMTGYSTLGGHTELVLSGDTVTLGNTILSVNGSNAISNVGVNTPWRIQGFKITTTTAGNCIQADGHSFIYIGNNIFGACANATLLASYASFLETVDNFTIAGSSQVAIACQYRSLCLINSATITLTGTPAFSNQFVYSVSNSDVEAQGLTFSGSATGVRYSVLLGAAINSGTGSATYFPGNSAGSNNCTTSASSIGICGFYN